MLLPRPLISLKLLHLGRIHKLRHMIGLPLLELEAHAFMRVVLLIRLVLMILDLHELGIARVRVQTQTDEARDRCRFGDEPERPGLLVFELDERRVGADYLVGVVCGGGEELGEREPLACHFVPVIGVDELVVVDTVGCVAFYARDGGLAGVEGDDLRGIWLAFPW